jgi:urease beta subunit
MSSPVTSSTVTTRTETPAPVKPFVPSHPVPPFKGAFPHRAEPMADATGRVVSIKFVRNGGDVDVAPVFAVTNLTDKPVRVGQTWIFYYDAQKKQLDSYPSSFSGSLELAPGETKEKRIGISVEKLKKDTSIIEGEVSSARVGDKDWANENLIDLQARPAGGFAAQNLEDRAGERVVVDVYSLASKRVRLTNVTDHPVKEVDLHFYYVDAKNELHSAWAPSQKLAGDLAPGASIDFTPKTVNARDMVAPPGARKVVAFADEVGFSDGTPTFKSRNLRETRRWEGLATK